MTAIAPMTPTERVRRSAGLLLLIGGLGACSSIGNNRDPETRAVDSLSERGFMILSDGRSSPNATLMSYSGPATGIIECGVNGGRLESMLQDIEYEIPDQPYDGRRTGSVTAQVAVANDGSITGLFANTLTREFVVGDRVLRSETEIREMRPGEFKMFSDGLVCRPKP